MQRLRAILFYILGVVAIGASVVLLVGIRLIVRRTSLPDAALEAMVNGLAALGLPSWVAVLLAGATFFLAILVGGFVLVGGPLFLALWAIGKGRKELKQVKP